MAHDMKNVAFAGYDEGRRQSSSRNQASRDYGPAPTPIKKSRLIVKAKSVFASLTMNQKHLSGRNNSGILVVAITVRITIRSRMLAFARVGGGLPRSRAAARRGPRG